MKSRSDRQSVYPSSLLVHHDIKEALILKELGYPSVMRHGAKTSKPRALPSFGTQIDLGGVVLHELKAKAFELQFRTPGHLWDFNFSPSRSLMSANSDRRRIVEFSRQSVSFAHAGADLYRLTVDNDETPHDLIAMVAAPEYVDSLIAESLDGNLVNFTEAVPPAPWQGLIRAQSALRAFFRAPDQYCKLTAEAVVNDIILRSVLRWSSLGARNGRHIIRVTDQGVNQAIEFVHDNLTREISLADIQTASGLSFDALAMGMKQATGRTPYDYLLTARIEATKEKLRQGKLPISEIARSYRFNSASHFSTTFKRMVGMSPRMFRKTLKS